MSSVPDESYSVEFIEHNPRSILTGTGRYMRELYRSLAPLITIRWASTIDPPFTSFLPSLHHFPIGVQKHQEGRIVHFTQPLGSSLMLWNPLRPSVATVHDLSWLAWPPERRMFRKLERLILHLNFICLKRMDAIITISDHTRQSVIRCLGISPSQIFTIYSGNRSDQFKPVFTARARLLKKYPFFNNNQYKYLLYVGNEFPRKNLTVALKALSLLPGHIRMLKVGNAGGQVFREQTLRTITGLRLEDRVTFIEDVPDEDLVLFYNAADLYVCGSFLEGFCHPVLEAMACGLPVICSNAATLPEIAGDAAILVSPTHAAGFAEAIQEVLENREHRDHMIATGLQRAAAFSWEQTAQAVMNVYRQVSSMKGNSRSAGARTVRGTA